MKKRNWDTLVLGSVGMLVVILDGKTSVAGVRQGLELCLNTLIPSLFPFFILSSLVTSSLAGHSIGPLGTICRFCRMGAGSESLLAVGLLGGYPIGAANIAAELKYGHICREDAQRMAIFCNNAGPSFVFGVLGPLFPHSGWVWLLWIIQICSAVFTGFFLPGKDGAPVTSSTQQQTSLSSSLNRSIRSMAMVCGWVVLFRMILEFLQKWFLWLLPVPVQVIATGLLELSNGCLALTGIPSPALRFLIAGSMLSLGGICVWMQTRAVFPELNLRCYIKGRALHCLICILLSILVLPLLNPAETEYFLTVAIPAGISMICLFWILRKGKKAVAF